MMENLSDSPAIDETLVQLGVENETSIATLISALKGILSKVKKFQEVGTMHLKFVSEFSSYIISY
jgi:hypothetical protein